MSGALSKRQQARNERTLQDLIKSVPGNNICADCQARNPGWASWSLGIFLCMRCAALHRKLGTHITKVKSLSMDSWSNDQVEHMKRVGNIVSNRIYNPQNTRPPIPFDADEADSAMERFIRQKYAEKAASVPARHNHTGSTNSDDQPPPLPPKHGSRFGFRSASSIFPLSKSRRETARLDTFQEPARAQSPPSPPRNKPSRVFGTSIGSENDIDSAEFETKMDRLRDMGFSDVKRNRAVLKGLSGNMEKSIETLVRLGEGNGKGRELPPPPSSRPHALRSGSAGITIDRTRDIKSSRPGNPFDMLDAPKSVALPQSSQSTGGLASLQMMGNNPYQQPPSSTNSNPFGLAPSQSQYNLNQAFQNMSVTSAQPAQQLFPNRTGGFPEPQLPQQQHLFQQSVTPPVPSLPQQHYPSVIYENPAQQAQQQQQQSQRNNIYNPFMQQGQQAPQLNTNLPTNPYQQQLATPQSLYQSSMDVSPVAARQYPVSAGGYDNGGQHTNPFLQGHSAQQPQQQMNPFFNQQTIQQQPTPPQQAYDFQKQQQQQQQQQQHFRQQTHPLMPHQTGRADKSTIMDMFNYPQLAPTPTQQQAQIQQEQPPMQNPVMVGSYAAPQQEQQQQQQQQQQHQQQMATTSPPREAASKNPFASSTGSAGQEGDLLGNLGHFPLGQNNARSRESMMAMDAGGWTNGRHSPDAWGSVSARSVR